MKQAISFLLALSMIVILCACGGTSAPTEADILHDLKERPLVYPFELESVQIVRSQKTGEDKVFSADIEISGKNRFANYSGTAQVIYNLYDQGWMLDEVNNLNVTYEVYDFQTPDEIEQTVMSADVFPDGSNNRLFMSSGIEGSEETAIVLYSWAPYSITCDYQGYVRLLFNGSNWICSTERTSLLATHWEELCGDYSLRTYSGQSYCLTVLSADENEIVFSFMDNVYTLPQSGEIWSGENTADTNLYNMIRYEKHDHDCRKITFGTDPDPSSDYFVENFNDVHSIAVCYRTNHSSRWENLYLDFSYCYYSYGSLVRSNAFLFHD